ncbi:MAG: hypothetical protein ACE5FW_01795 [Candidatus Aenigmatarchaeota archaeon]
MSRALLLPLAAVLLISGCVGTPVAGVTGEVTKPTDMVRLACYTGDAECEARAKEYISNCTPSWITMETRTQVLSSYYIDRTPAHCIIDYEPTILTTYQPQHCEIPLTEIPVPPEAIAQWCR